MLSYFDYDMPVHGFDRYERRVRWPRQVTIRNQGPKIGRNDPCPCESGKKNKHCCERKF